MAYKQLSRKDYQRLIGIANKKKKPKARRRRKSDSKRWHHCSRSVAGQNDKQRQQKSDAERCNDRYHE